MRVTLIHNPVAGSSAQPTTDELKRLIRSGGHELAHHVCATPAVDWTRLLEVPCDVIAVAGGDGTAGRIAKRLAGYGLPVTFLPLGTANNIARSFELSQHPLERLIAGWHTPRSQWIDIGLIDSPWGATSFIEGAGIGLFVRTMLEIDAEDALKHLARPEEKVVEALRIMSERLKSFPVRRLDLTLDGRDLSGDYLLLEVMNIRYIGPNLHVAPTGDPTDGLLDVVLVGEHERAELQRCLRGWRRGAQLAPALRIERGHHLRLSWSGSVLHVDDEAWPEPGAGHHPMPVAIDFRARPRALELLLPNGDALR